MEENQRVEWRQMGSFLGSIKAIREGALIGCRFYFRSHKVDRVQTVVIVVISWYSLGASYMRTTYKYSLTINSRGGRQPKWKPALARVDEPNHSSFCGDSNLGGTLEHKRIRKHEEQGENLCGNPRNRERRGKGVTKGWRCMG
jgi:hypothetical protein